MISSMFSLFYLQLLNKLNFEALNFLLFREVTISEWFLTWCFKMIESCTYVYSESNRSLIEFLDVFCIVYFFIR